MAREESPAYQWYVKDWRSSRKVQLMSFKVRGMYREMLDEQWDSCASLPNDPAQLRLLLGGSDADWKKHLPELRLNFRVLDDGTLLNDRIEKERAKQVKRRQEGSNGGKARAEGAERDHGGRFQPAVQPATAGPPASGTAGETPAMLLHLHLPSHLPVADCRSHLQVAGGEPPPTARSKRPIFSGQKLTVFEWQLDDCRQTLGQFTDDFDLHEWFFSLDKLAYDSNLVIPKKDGGAWLQAQLIAEAQRRGLPLVIDVPRNKQITALQQAGREFLTNDGRR